MTFNLHLFGFFVILLSSTEIFSQKVKTFVDYRKEAEAIIKAIPEVKIEGPEIDVAKFTGTVPDEPGSFDFRAGIQKAIDELSAKGGGRVLLSHPEGPDAWIKNTVIYKCEGPLQLKSNVELCLDKSVKLFFKFDPKNYLPGGKGVLRRYEGTTMFSFAPLIYAINARNIAITTRAGDGATPTIDGDGEKWQQWMLQGETKREKAGRIASYKYAKQLNNDNLPLDKRIFINPEEDFFRPGLIEFYLCERVKVEGVKLTNSPFWVIHPIFSKNLVFRNLFYDCQVVNNDGIDPESCHNVLIENIIFNNHDDNVAIKSGRDREAREGLAVMGLITDSLNTGFLKDGMLKGRSENIVIRNSVFKGHHAICIGSEIAGGAKNIYAFDNIAPQEVYIGIFLKSSRKRGGTIENVFVENFKMNECKVAAITLNPNYDGDPESKFPPSLKNVYIQDVTVNKAKKGISLWGWPDSITKNIFLKNININQTVDERFEYNHIEGVILTNVKVKGQIFDGQYKKSEVKSLPPRQD